MFIWFMVIHHPNTPPLDNFPPFASEKISLGRSSLQRSSQRVPWCVWCALGFFVPPPRPAPPLPVCCAHRADCCAAECYPPPKSPHNKNPTMSLFLISQSFGPYNVVFISGGSVEEGFCLRLFCINPTDNATKKKKKGRTFFHFQTQLNEFTQAEWALTFFILESLIRH